MDIQRWLVCGNALCCWKQSERTSTILVDKGSCSMLSRQCGNQHETNAIRGHPKLRDLHAYADKGMTLRIVST